MMTMIASRAKKAQDAQSPDHTRSSVSIAEKTHFIEECSKLKNKESRKNNPDGKASVVTGAGSDSGDCLVVLASCVSGNEEWILDFACSFHICTNRDWFSSFRSVQKGDVVRM
jgi:hypothetical protein